LHYIALHYITLHCITLHYITLHYITLHYITLHYITLHYITLHYITITSERTKFCLQITLFSWLNKFRRYESEGNSGGMCRAGRDGVYILGQYPSSWL